MLVNAPLEIYSVVIGAKLYDSLFAVLCGFCVVYIPLAMMFIESLERIFEEPFHQVADTANRRVGVKLFVFVVSAMICVAPTWPVSVDAITYTPVCSPNAEQSTWGNTGTTYDQTLGAYDYQGANLPIGLSVVLTAVSGITNAAIAALPCYTNVQQIQQVIHSTRLTPALAQQVSRFTDECYAPARSEFQQQQPNPSTYQATMNNYGGQDDLSWIGSHTYQQLYYSTLYPKRAVKGFPINEFPDPNQATNSKAGVTYQANAGYPSCEEWWSNTEYGLEHQLVQLAQHHAPNNPHLGAPSLATQVQSWLAKVKTTTHLGSQVTADDVIAHNLLSATAGNSGFGDNFMGQYVSSQTSQDGIVGQTLTAARSDAAIMGQGAEAAWGSIKRQEQQQEIPIILALLFAIILLLGPVILVAGSYRFKVVFSYYFILSSVIFTTYIERAISYLENSIHASMSSGVYSLMSYGMIYNIFTKLYYIAPVLFLMLMSICGVTVGDSIQSKTEYHGFSRG